MTTMADTNAGAKTKLQRFMFILKLLEIRLRFVAILLLTALIVGYWDTITNYWERWTRAAPSAQSSTQTQSDTEYFCPMHPFVVRATMGKCPICGMDLIQRKKGAPETLPAGTVARVQVSPERIMQAGVKVEPVTYRKLSRSIDAFGTVEVDESRWTRVTARFPGRVEEVFVESPGVEVKKDQPLAKIYSPKYLAATLEFVQAVQAKHRTQADVNADAEAKRYAAELADITRKPLERQGFTKEQLDQIERDEKTTDRVTLVAPTSGTIVEKNVAPGDSVEEGTVLFTVADLSAVWVIGQIAESELIGIHPGTTADVMTVAHQGESFPGKVDLVYPSVNPENRTVRVRLTIANKESKLKPGMYVNLRIAMPVPGESTQQDGVLSVPEAAVIDTGTRKVVYVESSSGVYDAREVRLGARAGEYYPVLSGISAEDKVVIRGSFLIDAEARLNPANAQMQEVSSKPNESPTSDAKPANPKDDYPLDTCIVSGEKLGVMGEPVTKEYKGRKLKFCCAACIKDFDKDPEKFLSRLDSATRVKK